MNTVLKKPESGAGHWWIDGHFNDTTRCMIEVSVAGGHHLDFWPEAGHPMQWATYDLDRVSIENRDYTNWWIASCGGEAFGTAAAHKLACYAQAAAIFLAREVGGDVPLVTIGVGALALVDCIRPVTLADFVSPPPREHWACVVDRIIRARTRRNDEAPLDEHAEALVASWKKHVPVIDEQRVAQSISVARTIQALGRDMTDVVTRLSMAQAISFSKTVR